MRHFCLLSFLFLLFLPGAGCRPRPDEKVANDTDGRHQEAPPEVQRAAFSDICPKAQDNRIPVLMFHDVTKSRGRGSVWFDCTADELQTMAEWFNSEQIKPISLDQLFAHLTSGTPVPEKAIVLTFDDNYQGFYDNALPILKKYKFPAAMFVHTDFVGSQQNRPKMTWDTLQKLLRSGLVTIGSHTLSHPKDITQIPYADQQREITESKKVLEDHLGIPMQYFAYPDGNNDAATQAMVRQAGYKMAFTMKNGPAEESPNIVAVDRYIQTKYKEAWDDRETAFDSAPAAVVEMNLRNVPITYETGKFAGIGLALIKGGNPSSRRALGRQGVLEFIRDAGASAGINGTFFAMVTITGTSNEMVGPVYASNEKFWAPDKEAERMSKIRNRPMVVWGPAKIAIFPFQENQMNDEATIRWLMPDFTDAFVAGGWIVHAGKARTREQLEEFSARDLMDYRRRAFFGLLKDGTVVLGASLGSVSSVDLSQAAAKAGVEEAIMMDSGFSTSLVYGDKVVASGHSTPTMPSRPVPHAIVLVGTLAIDPNTISIPQPPAEPKRKRKKKKVETHESGPEITIESATPPPLGGNDVPPIPSDPPNQ